MTRPRLFVGSSSESLEVAYAAQENLEHDCETTVWTQDVFDLSKFVLESLLDALDDYDFAMLIFAPDDVTRIRANEVRTPRDNVVFELGLFTARLGRERVFLVAPRGDEELHLPTDLLGITLATYEARRQDRNLVAALGPACNRIRKRVQKFGTMPIPVVPKSELTELSYDDADILSIVEHWYAGQPNGPPGSEELHKFSQVERELDLPRGSARKVFEQVAKRFGMEVVRIGSDTIKLRRPDQHDFPF